MFKVPKYLLTTLFLFLSVAAVLIHVYCMSRAFNLRINPISIYKKHKEEERKTKKEAQITKLLNTLTEESKTFIIDKLTFLRDLYAKIDKHLNDIKDKDGEKTIADEVKSKRSMKLDRLSCHESFDKYEFLLLKLAIQQDKTLQNSFQIEPGIQEKIDAFEAQYRQFFADLAILRNKADVESFTADYNNFIEGNVPFSNLDRRFKFRGIEGIYRYPSDENKEKATFDFTNFQSLETLELKSNIEPSH